MDYLLLSLEPISSFSETVVNRMIYFGKSIAKRGAIVSAMPLSILGRRVSSNPLLT